MIDGETMMARLLPEIEAQQDQARQVAARLGELTDAELRDLLGALARHGDINGPAGELMGLCLVEGTARFMRANTEDLDGRLEGGADA